MTTCIRHTLSKTWHAVSHRCAGWRELGLPNENQSAITERVTGASPNSFVPSMLYTTSSGYILILTDALASFFRGLIGI